MNRLLFSLLFLPFLAHAAPSPAVKPVNSRFKLKWESRFGLHLVGKKDLFSARNGFEFEQIASQGKWTIKGDFRAVTEGAYAVNQGRYGNQPIVDEETGEFVVRDLYLQYQSLPLQLTVGNQQVVWGETFGFYYADIVNPKNYREFGLLDLEYQRIPLLGLNAKLIFSRWALQFVAFPRPGYDQWPSEGSDFFPAPLKSLTASGVTLNPETGPSWSLDSLEGGARVSVQLGKVDTSLFFFNYFDRSPNLRLTVDRWMPFAAHLDRQHFRIQTLGWTGTWDASSVLIRWEGVYTPKRFFDSSSGLNLSQVDSPEATLVLGLDYPGISNWNLGLQGSENRRLRSVPGAFSKDRVTLVTMHAVGTPLRDHSLEGSLSYSFQDQGAVAQLRYVVPQSKRLEFGGGADLIFGKKDSTFGQYSEASRFYALMRGYLGEN